ncbi:dipeptidyl peptidase, putative [Babesia ovata]|uniref:Dipeptidyl peptidase, putative n=1 Tax=Babesia ovata TaxID=189622 RepID=A0A2H6K7K8_9APIC|nr:dipeptidyl peptidase, putative [Babesia ovata]GBE58976.1 dipeptidyl peptidase, putative [Babesia ovata]
MGALASLADRAESDSATEGGTDDFRELGMDGCLEDVLEERGTSTSAMSISLSTTGGVTELTLLEEGLSIGVSTTGAPQGTCSSVSIGGDVVPECTDSSCCDPPVMEVRKDPAAYCKEGARDTETAESEIFVGNSEPLSDAALTETREHLGERRGASSGFITENGSRIDLGIMISSIIPDSLDRIHKEGGFIRGADSRVSRSVPAPSIAARPERTLPASDASISSAAMLFGAGISTGRIKSSYTGDTSPDARCSPSLSSMRSSRSSANEHNIVIFLPNSASPWPIAFEDIILEISMFDGISSSCPCSCSVLSTARAAAFEAMTKAGISNDILGTFSDERSRLCNFLNSRDSCRPSPTASRKGPRVDPAASSDFSEPMTLTL